jgi:hypothetical protein
MQTALRFLQVIRARASGPPVLAEPLTFDGAELTFSGAPLTFQPA